ncbi:MAG: carboxypeptidase regulatory-like domain-containing protein [Acidobacteriaceae bacterium]|nr:carboxypeptidase regulatory-like domain-containing protein [Acidobacteriaceae bacterium]MBV9779222.1 carboxypeptidase regulatory-like domain-containing protein [Acidobacteriaceae bacterium]
MRLLRLIVAVLAACLMLVAAAPQTKISVTVTDEHGKPVDNAAVILDFLGSHHQVTKLGKRKPVHWEVHTNQEGLAHFPPVPQGTIQLQVVAKNHQTFGNKFDIDTDEKMIDIKLNPPQEQYTANPTPKQ